LASMSMPWVHSARRRRIDPSIAPTFSKSPAWLHRSRTNLNGGTLRGATIASFSAIVVLDANDIVLAKIAARLNLDQLEVDLARVGEAMG
jgi:hypothetical protein